MGHEAALQRFEDLKKQTDEALAKWADLQKSDVATFQKMAAERGSNQWPSPHPPAASLLERTSPELNLTESE